MAHGANAALELARRLVMPHSVAATMSQCSSAVTKRARFSGLCRSQCSSLAKSPLVRIDAAAPLDAFEAQLVRLARDLLGLGKGAMIAPEIVFVERFQAFAHGNHAGTGGIERNGRHLRAVDAGVLQAPRAWLRPARPSGRHAIAWRNSGSSRRRCRG